MADEDDEKPAAGDSFFSFDDFRLVDIKWDDAFDPGKWSAEEMKHAQDLARRYVDQRFESQLRGEFKSSRNIRKDPESDFAKLIRRPAEAEFSRRGEWLRRKYDEEDFEERHMTPPEMRMTKLVEQFGPAVVLKVLEEILNEQGDLENVMDVLEPEMQMRHGDGRRRDARFGKREDFRW